MSGTAFALADLGIMITGIIAIFWVEALAPVKIRRRAVLATGGTGIVLIIGLWIAFMTAPRLC